MKIIANIKTNNKEEALKYAYSFMKANQLNMKECSFLNPNPKKFDSNYIVPRDMFSASYNSNIPAWEDFKINPVHLKSPGFTCVAALDKKDKKRVVLSLIGNTLNFNCYGDYVKEAEKAYEEILDIYASL